MFYDRHLFFFDFQEHGVRNPIWFNVVRDPVKKIVSAYHYNRQFGGLCFVTMVVSQSVSQSVSLPKLNLIRRCVLSLQI